MKSLKRFSTYVLSVFGVLMVMAPSGVMAQSYQGPYSEACKRGGADSAVCKAKNNATNPLTGKGGVLDDVVNILSIAAGSVAVILMFIGGIKYITSNGDSSEISSAKRTIIYALIGLVIVVLARAIINFVISKV